jgi:hypothetical protein
LDLQTCGERELGVDILPDAHIHCWIEHEIIQGVLSFGGEAI